MYNHIKGEIVEITPNAIILENNGIGYIIKTSNPYSYQLGEIITVYTHLHVREDAYELYGFKTTDTRDLFLELISVRGIGPKSALAIIANDDPASLRAAIKASDAKYLQKFPGIGPKASGQIILDLRGKLAKETDVIPLHPTVKTVKEALKSLGYSVQELKKLDGFLNDHLNDSIESLIKESLKRLV